MIEKPILVLKVEEQTNGFSPLTWNSSFDGLPVFNLEEDKLLWTSKKRGKFDQLFIADVTFY